MSIRLLIHCAMHFPLSFNMIVIIYYQNFIRYSSQAVDVCGPTVRPRGKTPQQCLISEESKTRLGNVDRDGRSPLNSVPDLTFVSA